MKPLLIVLLLSLLIGCCPTKETIVNERIDTLYVPVYADTDSVPIIRIDSIWTGETVKYIIKLDTLIKKVYVYRKADTVTVYHTIKDTVSVYKEIGDSFTENLKDYAIGAVLIILFGGLLIIVTKVKLI